MAAIFPVAVAGLAYITYQGLKPVQQGSSLFERVMKNLPPVGSIFRSNQTQVAEYRATEVYFPQRADVVEANVNYMGGYDYINADDRGHLLKTNFDKQDYDDVYAYTR
jgi:hypothetical protein